jgi:hypothetical protein
VRKKERWCFTFALYRLNLQAEFVSIDKQLNHQIMHLNGLEKADRLARQALDPSSQCRPKSALLFFLADIRPPFIHFRFLSKPNSDLYLRASIIGSATLYTRHLSNR